MTIDKWKEVLIRYLQEQGIVTDENKIWDLEVIDQLNGGKLMVWANELASGRKLSRVNYLRFTVDYDERIQQSSSFKRYSVPATLGGNVSWLGTNDFVCRFTEARSLADITSGFANMIPPKTRYLREAEYVDVYNMNIASEIGVEALVVNPLLCPSFNADLDDYPFDESLKGQLCQAIYKTYYSFANTKKLDVTNDNTTTK